MRDRYCYAKSNYFPFLLASYILCWGIVAGCLARASLALPSPSILVQADTAETEESSLPKSALRVGDRGAEVKALQEHLKELGYFEGEADGDYGGKTKAAVAKFQEQEGLDADGIAGTSTLERLEAVRAEKAKAAEKEAEETKPKTSSNSPSRRKFLLFVFGGSFLTFGVVGSGLFLLLRAFNRAMEPQDETVLPEEEEEEPSTAAYRQVGEAIAPPSETDNSQHPEPPSEAVRERDRQPEKKLIASPINLFKKAVSKPAEEDELSNFWEQDLPPEESVAEIPPPQIVSSPPENPSQPSPETQQPNPNGESLALREATRLPKIDRVEKLIEDLQESQPETRRKAIWELAQQADSRAVQPLIGLLIDSDSQQRGLILEALSQIGTRTLKPMNRALTIALQDENAQVRKNAIRDLTQMYELMGKLSKLLYLAIDDPDPEVQDTAKWALKQLNSLQMNWGDRSNSDS